MEGEEAGNGDMRTAQVGIPEGICATTVPTRLAMMPRSMGECMSQLIGASQVTQTKEGEGDGIEVRLRDLALLVKTVASAGTREQVLDAETCRTYTLLGLSNRLLGSWKLSMLIGRGELPCTLCMSKKRQLQLGKLPHRSGALLLTWRAMVVRGEGKMEPSGVYH